MASMCYWQTTNCAYSLLIIFNIDFTKWKLNIFLIVTGDMYLGIEIREIPQLQIDDLTCLAICDIFNQFSLYFQSVLFAIFNQISLLPLQPFALFDLFIFGLI